MGNFFGSASDVEQEQKILLIKTAIKLYQEQLEKLQGQTLWLSTHGKGVAWLHIRIDLTPKYISWNDYK